MSWVVVEEEPHAADEEISGSFLLQDTQGTCCYCMDNGKTSLPLPLPTTTRRTEHTSSRRSNATIYHALEDKIQKRHAMGYLRRDGGASVAPTTRIAADPCVALATRLARRPESMPVPAHDTLLPSSDLLNAIHGHAANVFTDAFPLALTGLDESALLALGIVVDQLVADTIGVRGHLLLEGGETAMLRERGIYTHVHDPAVAEMDTFHVVDDNGPDVERRDEAQSSVSSIARDKKRKHGASHEHDASKEAPSRDAREQELVNYEDADKSAPHSRAMTRELSTTPRRQAVQGQVRHVSRSAGKKKRKSSGF